jgi:2-polyprenyl-3-methyl-5-hydroxy-6-metoxy-1,4-benzoquinol methylase
MTKTYKVERHLELDYLRIAPTPTDEEIEKYYKEEFYSGEYKRFNDSELTVQQNDIEFFENIWKRIVSNLEDITHQKVSGKKVLDIGCGWGLALKFFETKGMLCYGIDPAPEAVDYAAKNGLNVKRSGIRDIGVYKEVDFDFVTLINVLEHIGNPEMFLSEVSQVLMGDNTILVIDVPNDFNCLQLAAQRADNLDEWWLAAPQHLNYFSLETLTKVLECLNMEVVYSESSFPLEFFLLMGQNYVEDSNIGKNIHKMRCDFEKNMINYDGGGKLREIYNSFSKVGIGRQITVYARKK